MGPKFWELMIVLAIVVLLFGPHRLAGLGECVGKALREFRDAIGSDVSSAHRQGGRQNEDG
jgi:sec-independent protein translocase protein TatA